MILSHQVKKIQKSVIDLLINTLKDHLIAQESKIALGEIDGTNLQAYGLDIEELKK